MTRLYGKDELKEILDLTAEKNRLSHAIMFSGRKGSGRKTLARYTAKLFLCENNACGECPTCRNIDMNAHPDVIFVKETLGGKYEMKTLRELLKGTVIKPNNGDVKIYVFEDCDSMLTQHQNALLKLIEEPPAHLRFIFTCENVNLVPITVMSRVTLYEVPETDIESCVRCLVEDGTDESRARELAETFSGNIGECKSALLDDSIETRLLNTAKKAAAAASVKDGFGTAAALSETKDRAELSAVMGYFTRIFRDALAVKEGACADFADKRTSLAAAENYTEDGLIFLLDRAFEINANEIYNLNPALTAAYFTAAFAEGKEGNNG